MLLITKQTNTSCYGYHTDVMVLCFMNIYEHVVIKCEILYGCILVVEIKSEKLEPFLVFWDELQGTLIYLNKFWQRNAFQSHCSFIFFSLNFSTNLVLSPV